MGLDDEFDPRSATDDACLEAWRRGHQRAGSELFGRYFDVLYQFFRTKVGAEAQDLVQETLLACVRAVPGLREPSAFRTYLFRVAHSRLCNHFERRGQRIDFGITSVADLGPSPSTAYRQKKREHALMGALTRLPLEQQVALEMYYFQGLRSREIAEILEIPHPTARSRLRRARSALSRLVRSPLEPTF